jgi:hypothetical protein
VWKERESKLRENQQSKKKKNGGKEDGNISKCGTVF